MDTQNTNKISLEIDLESNTMIGISNGDSSVEQAISKRIVNSISKTFRELSSNWLKEFDEEINNKKYNQAHLIFRKNKDLLQFSKNKSISRTLRSLDTSGFERDARKEYLIFITAYASHVNDRAGIDNEIDALLSEYKEELEPIMVQNLILEKANSAAINGLHNKASILYKKVINSPDSDAGTVAWAYQGLSKISDNDEDSINFSKKAADKHLEAGARFEAINNLLKISEIKANNSPVVALKLIDRCIDLCGDEKLLDRSFLASLKFTKSLYLQRIGNNIEALPLAKRACELLRGLIGNEIELHSSLALAAILANANGETYTSEQYKKEANDLAKTIDDENFLLRKIVGDLISSGNEINESLIAKVVTSGDDSIFSAVLLYQSSNGSLSIEEALDLLDRSRLLIERQPDKRLLEFVYFSIAEKYRHEGFISEALSNYKKALSLNPHLNVAVQNCTAMLFDTAHWIDAEIFIKTRIDLIGELPGICFYYGRALLENKKFAQAFKYLKKANAESPNRDTYLALCLDNINTSDLSELASNDQASESFICAEKLFTALEEFSYSISSDSRMHFWNRDKYSATYKWTKNPEELSKQMLITFLNAKFGKESIEILQEPRAGAGFIDLYILLSGGLKVVIELKMCGSGYSSTYALSGESQIIHYQLNKGTKLGFLVVFDARKRDFGKHFKRLQNINGHTIYSIAVDMRPEIKK